MKNSFLIIKFIKRITNRFFWKSDQSSSYRINNKLVASWFDKTQSLVFTEEAAVKEESTIIPLIHQKITSDSSILDLGCGNGRYADALGNDIKEYLGVDISQNFVKNANLKYSDEKINFVFSPAHTFIQKNKFDVILMIGLLTYMNDDEIEKMISNCKKMLNPGGWIIVRNVCFNESVRKVYDDKWNIIKKLLRKPPYFIIRRPEKEFLRFFDSFQLNNELNIPDTTYRLYVFTLSE